MREREELQRKADAALERIGYWDMLKFGIDTVAGFGGLEPLPVPSPSPTPEPGTVYTDLGIDASWAVPMGDEWTWREYDYTYHDYDYEPPKQYPSHDYDAEPGYEGVYPREPKLGEPPYDDYDPDWDAYHFLEWS